MKEAVREFAYAGEHAKAAEVLAAMSDQEEDRVLTYRGFLLRVSGEVEAGMAVYAEAILANPDNILVRSYMGQGFVTQGRTAEAKAQLAEIRARGGEGTWAEYALAQAITSGTTYAY